MFGNNDPNTIEIKLSGSEMQQVADLMQDRRLKGKKVADEAGLFKALLADAHRAFIDEHGYKGESAARMNYARNAEVGTGPGQVSLEEKMAAAFGRTPEFVQRMNDDYERARR